MFLRVHPFQRLDDPKLALRLCGTLVVLAAVAVYANTLLNGFVYDDLHQVLEDQRIRSIDRLPDVFISGVWSFKWGPSSYYRPMMQLSYFIVCQFFGLTPWAYHAANVFIHALASLALWGLALRLLKGRPGRLSASTVAATLFALHPVHTEAVAWVAAIPDLFLGLFGLSSLLAYTYAAEGRKAPYWTSLALFCFALLSKEPAIVLPAILVIIDLYFARDGGTVRRIRRLAPFGAAAVLYLAIRRAALGGIAPPGLHADLDLGTAVLTGFSYLSHYVRLCLWPQPLNALYTFHPVKTLFDPYVIASSIVVVMLCWFLLRWYRDRERTVAILLFALPLLPALYVPALGEGGLAERYLYLPLAGVALGAGQLYQAIAARGTTRALPILVLALVVVPCVGTAVTRNAAWRDEKSLWVDTVEKSPSSAVAREFLCYAYLQKRELEAALRECRESIRLDSRRTNAHVNQGAVLLELGRSEEAVASYREAIALNPRSFEARFGSGTALLLAGRFSQARDALMAAAALNDGHPLVHDMLGIAQAQTGDAVAAERSFRRAIELDPGQPVFREHLEATLRAPGGTSP